MKRIFLAMVCGLFLQMADAKALPADYFPYFRIDLKQEIPDIKELTQRMKNAYVVYDKGYHSRYDMGLMFKREFSRTIRLYGLSEGRIKADYEDELLDIINMLPKETYPYIGPMLHNVPGMSEKILNLPGIKETKNKFPEKVAERFKGMEDIEYLSPSLYFLLMPDLWGEYPNDNQEQPQQVRMRKPKVDIEIPDFLKEKAGIPLPTAEKKKAGAQKKSRPVLAERLGFRTISPTLTSPLTTKDIEAFIETLDEINEWGNKNDMENSAKLINGENLLNFWEREQGTALPQNDLKDLVNPCQRMVQKTHFSNQYYDFANLVMKHGFTPEEWAYTCDKTIKAFRIAEANLSMAYAIRLHRRGYFRHYIEQLPKKWREGMYATEATLIRMYTALQEDVDVVRPLKDVLRKKFTNMRDILLITPIIY